MASSLLSFVITIVLVALGAAASGKGKMKKTRKFIPPNPAWRNGQPVQTAPMQQEWANRPPIPQGQPVQQRVNQQLSQGQMRAYQKQMPDGNVIEKTAYEVSVGHLELIDGAHGVDMAQPHAAHAFHADMAQPQ